MRYLTRRNIVASIVGVVRMGIGTSLYTRLFEPRWLDINSEVVKLKNHNLKSQITILHMSDFHDSKYVSYNFIEYAIKKGLEQNPDIICLTGDFITRTISDYQTYKRILKRLSSSAPTFACLGNHDGRIFARAHGGHGDSSLIENLLIGSNIQCLINERSYITINDQRYCLVGLCDLWSVTKWKENSTFNSEQPLFMPVEKYPTIVLSHNPDTKRHLLKYNWDLMLCGHTHGGQLKLPILGTPFAPVQDKRYVKGLHNIDGKWIHITKGIGNLHGLRINCSPQISVLKVV